MKPAISVAGLSRRYRGQPNLIRASRPVTHRPARFPQK
jgi:hypothetical protein